MIKSLLSFIVFFIVITLQATATDPILLHYKFADAPMHFVIAKSGNIYVDFNSVIFKFDKQGNLIKKIMPQGAKGQIVSFEVSDDEKTIYLSTGTSIYARICSYQFTGKMNYSIKFINGSNLKVDQNGILYVSYQDASDAANPALNKLRVFESSGKNYDYHTSIDIAADNFEVIQSQVVFYTPADGYFYLLPIIGSHNSLKTDKTKLVLPIDESVPVIGSIGDKYCFKYFDSKNHQDVIIVYAKDLKSYQKYTLPFNSNDIIYKDNDFITDNRSGSVYSYDQHDHIYFLRNTKKGAMVYDLNNYIK